MIIHDVEQGREEWMSLHLGLVTAGRFGQLLTAKKREPSSQIKAVVDELCAEWMLGEPVNNVMTPHMQRGLELETEAIGWYEFDQGADVSRVGFITDAEIGDATCGCSPDGLVGDDGGLEIKCPGVVKCVHYDRFPRDLIDTYYAQCQGGMLLTGRQWWDLVSWHPDDRIPNVLQRIERDDEYCALLQEQIAEVNRQVHEYLVAKGFKKAEAA